jgi:5-methylcytosine-specific restriction endonuclease McrA
MSEEWKGSKSQREALRSRFDGRCGYCGEVLVKMQADHIKPVTRLTMDAEGRPLPSSERRMMNPENNVMSNMMPACPPCNNTKGGYSLEGWRDLIQRSAEIVAREKPIFRAGVRMGVISVSATPVVFYFERNTPTEGE